MTNLQFGAIYKFKHGGISNQLKGAIPCKQGLPAKRFQVPHDDLPGANPSLKDWLYVVISGNDALNYIVDKARATKACFDGTYQGVYSSEPEGALLQVDADYALKESDADGNPVILVNSSEQAMQIINTLA